MIPKQVKRDKVRKVYTAIQKPTPFQRHLARVKENVNFQKTQLALTALDSRYKGLQGTDHDKIMNRMKAEIHRTMGEAIGTRLPIERGLY